MGSPPLAAVPEPQDHEGVDYEHHPPPRLGDGQQTQLLANLAQIRRTLHPTGDDAA